MRIYVWYPVLASMCLGFTFMNIPPLGRQFMDLMGVGYDGLSILLTGLFWTHAFLQLPAGLIADRFDPKKLMIAGLAICILGNLLPFFRPDSLILASLLRAVTGVGTSISFLAMMKLILILAPPEKVPSIQGFQGAGFSVGFALPYLVLPHLPGGLWIWSYLASALALLLALLCALFFVPGPRSFEDQICAAAAVSKNKKSGELGRTVRSILTSKPIWILGIFHGLSYGSMNNLGNWLPSMLADLDGVGEPSAWAMSAMALLLVGAFGRAFGGKLSARFSRSRVVNNAVILVAALYLITGLGSEKYLVLTASLLMALACGSTYGGIFSLSAAAGGLYAATAMGVMNMIGNIFNVLLTLMFGYIRQHTGEFSLSLTLAGAVALLFWFVGRRPVKEVEEQSRAVC